MSKKSIAYGAFFAESVRFLSLSGWVSAHETLRRGVLVAETPGGPLKSHRYWVSLPAGAEVARFDVSNAGGYPEFGGRMLVGRKGRSPVVRSVDAMVESLHNMTADRSLYYLMPARDVGMEAPPSDMDQAHAAAALFMALTEKVNGECLLPAKLRTYSFFPRLALMAAPATTFSLKPSGCNYVVQQYPAPGAATVDPFRVAVAISQFAGPHEVFDKISRWPRDPVFSMVRLLFPDTIPALPSSWRNSPNIWTRPGGARKVKTNVRRFNVAEQRFAVVVFASDQGYSRPMWVVL